MGSVTSIEASERGASGCPIVGTALVRDSLVDKLFEQTCQFCGGIWCNCGCGIDLLLQR